jgi:type III restriction enzyme
MTAFSPKTYQQSVLDSVTTYFRACHETQDADTAFYATTKALWGEGQKYRPLAGFPAAMPYFCLRVPTGGGKTWLAAKSLKLVNDHLLRCERSVILWLVPSKPIREQTLRGLKGREHPYHTALREAGPVTVLDLDEAKSLTRATLDTSTVVIVATRQAFQVEDAESRKVYESSGALMHHFDGLSTAQRASLLQEGETTPYSLANVLRLRRPFVIVDEAHNNRTPLAFDMLARFNPSGVLELTATPDLERTPSNVLHSVSAGELKAEQMIKLPVLLEAEPNWQQCLADAIARREGLQALAQQEQRRPASADFSPRYLRPIVLIQAEPRRAGVETLDVERVRRELIDNQRIPAEQIVVATGEEHGLEDIDAKYPLGIADPACPVRFIITQKALAEGWDCPHAYILVSMAAVHSSTAVEQLLGRVLRQPEARHFENAALNRAYAFVVSANFAETAAQLRERLIAGAGFERREVREFVTAADPTQAPLDLAAWGDRVTLQPVDVSLANKPALKNLPKLLRDKLTWDAPSSTLTIVRPLDAEETVALQQVVDSEPARTAIACAAERSRTLAVDFFQTPAELGERFAVPQLCLRHDASAQPTLFDDPEVLDYPWDLSPYDAAPTADDLQSLSAGLKVSEGGEIDFDAATGTLQQHFIADLQRDLGMVYHTEHWDEVKLAAWLARNLPKPSLTHAAKQVFIAHWLGELLLRPGFDLARANLQKFLLRDLIERRVKNLRAAAIALTYQETLFGDGKQARVTVDAAQLFEFHPLAYAPSRDYDAKATGVVFRKHYYGRLGAFDSREEFECAVQLDQWAQAGRIRFWVRNLVRREACSFFLQKAGGRFYPDFVCLLPDDRVLVVEYKGADRWRDAADDRQIGELWAELSAGRCQFVMVKDKHWADIERLLPKANS